VWVDARRSASAITRSIEDAERRVRQVAPFRTVVTVEPRVRGVDGPEGEGSDRPRARDDATAR
jgi:hypothetical protein